jgi:hypothetical protein
LSTRNKVFIAGIVGVVILIAGFDRLMADYEASERALDLQFPGREKDGVPGGFYLAFMGVVLLAISGLISGASYVILDRTAGMKPAIVRSIASGAAAGLLIFLATCAMTIVNASSAGLEEAATALFTGAFYMAPFFIIILFLLAAFGALGGVMAKLAVMGLNRIRNNKA